MQQLTNDRGAPDPTDISKLHKQSKGHELNS